MLVVLMNKVNFISMSNFVNSQIIISAPINFISKIKKLIVTHRMPQIDIVSVTITHEIYSKNKKKEHYLT